MDCSSSPVGSDGSRSLYGSADKSPPLQPKVDRHMEPFSIDDGSQDDGPGGTGRSEEWRDDDACSPISTMAQTLTPPTTTATTATITDTRMRLLFGIMGLGTLFPYNAIITFVTCE